MEASAAPNPTPCWSSVVQNQTQKREAQTRGGAAVAASTSQMFVESCKSTKGIAVAVVDANAIIQGGEKLANSADKFVSVPEVIAEIRDPVSRHRLAFVPFSLDTMEPSPEALNKVIKFARATGDLQTLSDVDLKLIALTYTLEAQIHGTNHLRDVPPPVHTINVKRLPEKDLPGWGSNVPNLEEWEALEQQAENELNPSSRILPLKDLNLNVIASDVCSLDGSVEATSESQYENLKDVEQDARRPRRYSPKKKEVKVEGKKMVADGIDASQGQFDDDAGDWMPAVSRSTHRRYLRRKARREQNEALVEKDCQEDLERRADKNSLLESTESDQQLEPSVDEAQGIDFSLGEVDSDNATTGAAVLDDNIDLAVEKDNDILVNEGLDHVDKESIDTSHADDVSSEQSWMLRSLSESSVACVTGDFAMQNILLQMGLRLLAPGGVQIRQLHRWVLKCHACYTVNAEIGRIFCPKCGNGGTLRKVAVTVGENGITLAAHHPRISVRGTKFSLPLPQGGRDAITKNLILREDQLPQKLLYPKTKKKVNRQGDDFMVDNIFTHHTDRRAPLQPPVRKALAVFGGKRNPNDNHYSRSKQK